MNVKKCSDCGKTKLESEFALYRPGGSRKARCRECMRAYDKTRWSNNPKLRERVREWERNHPEAKRITALRRNDDPEFKQRRNERQRKRYSDPSEQPKTAARVRVRCALNSGNLSKKACSVCGNNKAQAHHPDYSKPLDIVWLCCKHHLELHAAERRTARAALAPDSGADCGTKEEGETR